MNKLYACTRQGRTLLATILMLVLTPLSILTFGQSPCTSPVIREATNAKSTNSNVYDDITIAMTNLLGNGTEAAWVMEPGGTFTENPDGTARLQGTVKQFGDNVPPRRMAMDVILGGKSFTPDASGPYNQTGVATDGWYYYYTLSGTFTGLDALDGGKLSLAIHMHPFQVGIGANQMFNSEDQVANGAGGWFEWTVVTQPTDNTLQFTNYIPGITISDFAMLLSGTPSTPCVLNGSIGDQLYCDVNNNGIFDTGDSTVTGLTVVLYDANGVEIARQDVDANGKYLFTDLPAGTYTVKFPETTLDGKPQRDLGDINVNLAAGENFLDADKGYYKAPVGSIGDQLYCDVNNNGIFDAGDLVATGLTVTLCNANGVQIATQTVDASGKYLFTNLAAGTYIVKFPATTVDGKPQRTIGNITVNLGAGQNYLDADKGYYKDPCLNDTQAPVLSSCPKDRALTANCKTNQVASTWTTPTATDNCSTPTVVSTYTSGTKFNVGTTVVMFTATDAAGNTSTCSFSVIVKAAVDTTKPVLTCPINKTLTANCKTNQAIATWTTPTATDNCSTPTVVSSHTSGTKFNVGTTVVTLTATDGSGNASTCSFSIIVKAAVDTTKPVLTCPINKTLTADCKTNQAVATWTTPTATDNCSTPTVVSSHTSGTKFNVGTTVVTLTATDAAGNASTCSFSVIVKAAVDITKPVLVNCPTNMTLTADCRTNQAVATWTTPTATDNCSTPTVVSSHTSGTKFNVGTTVVTFTARDAAGNTATCSFSVIVKAAVDTQAPVFANCPTSIQKDVVNSTSTCWAINWTAPTATDNCSTPTITSNYNSGYCFPAGLTVVNYTATDAAGNTATCSFGVNIIKTTSCSVSGNTVTKSCVNNLPVLTGTALSSHEYMWVSSTTGCPTQTSPVIAGATGQNYTLPSRVTVTTYFARFARPIGCTTWASANGSNCITVNANECAPVDACTGVLSVRSVKNTLDNCGASSGQPYVALFNGNFYTAGSDLKFTEYTNGTALLKGTIYTQNVAYWINMTFSGKTTVSSGSPKVDLCAVGQTSGSSWYYYTTTGGQINTPTGTYSLTRQGPAFQVGQFANLQQNTYGASGWFLGNGSVPGDVNFNLDPIEACGTVTPPTCAGIATTIFTDCTNAGITRNLEVGNYTLAQLNALGIPDNMLSSIKVYPGFKVTLYQDDNFTTNPLVLTADVPCLTDRNYNDITSSIKVECLSNTTPTSCTVSGNTVTKSCVNNLPVLTGTSLANHEYMWLASTTGCPTQSSQAIAGATGSNYTLPSVVSTTTYFVRCARPIGCTTWGTINESNCITVTANECGSTVPTTCTGTGATIYTDCINWGTTRNLTVGTYTLAQLNALGIPDNMISSIKVYPGFKVTLYQDDNFTTNPLVLTADVACLTDRNYNDITTSIKVECLSNTTPTCTVSGNTISKTCVNNLPVVTGAALSNYEYVWLSSTTGCPTQTNQAIVGATGQNYSLPSRVTVTTYFVRCARPIGCTTWGTINESNCVTIYPTDCAPTSSNYTVSNCGGNGEQLILKGTIDCIAIGNTMSQSEDRNNCAQNPSSSRILTLPTGATIKAAYLYWSGSGTLDNTVSLNGNAVVAQGSKTFYEPSWGMSFFGARADVTNLVQSGGTYTVSNLTWNNTGNYCYANSAYGAWSMVVVYEKAGLTYSTIHINTDNFRYTFPQGNYSSTINCINVPAGCSSNASLTIISFEGDNYKGEYLYINGQYQGDNLFRGQTGPNLDILTFNVANSVVPGTTSLNYNINSYYTNTIWGGAVEGLFDYIKILKYNSCSSSANFALANDVLDINAKGELNRSRIEWVNNTGYKNDFFTVEKMNNTGNFEKLEIINTKNTDVPEQYVSYDNNPTEGDNLYRIGVTFNDGTTKYSETKKVVFSNILSVRVFPNPADDYIDVDLQQYKGLPANIYLYNSFGQQVQFINIDKVGDGTTRLDVAPQSPGTYILRVTTKDKRDVTKQIIISK